MANRTLSRSIALQTLYEIDFRSTENPDVESLLKRNTEDFAPGLSDLSFAKKIISLVLQKKNELDLVIEKAAPEWPIARISIIDRNILRVGLAELLFSDRGEVPAKVAINEAIELAKTFGGETSGRFVNGVLGAVYRELGEPGKEEVSKKKHDDVPDALAPLEKLVGAIVYADTPEGLQFAFVHDVFKHWTLSKGHIMEGETDEVCVVRVIKDELGLTAAPAEKLGETSYITYNKEKKKIRKSVVYYLAKAEFAPIVKKTTGGLLDAKWFLASTISALNFYEDILPIVTKSVTIISKK